MFRGHSDYYGCDIVIERRNGDLFLLMGTGPGGGPFWRFRLECFDAGSSKFVYATTGENEVGLSAIRLVWKDGVVIGIVDDWLNGTASPGEPGTGLGEIERQK